MDSSYPGKSLFFSQCGREVGMIFRPLLAAKGGYGDGVRDQEGGSEPR